MVLTTLARCCQMPFPKFPVVPSTGGGYLQRRRKIIRLALKGCANRPFFHVVITNSWRHRDVQPFEQLGTYDPMPNKDGQILLSLNLERIRYWIGRGALFTDNMQELMGMIGFLPIAPRTVQTAWENRQAAEKALKEQQEKEAAATEGADKKQ